MDDRERLIHAAIEEIKIRSLRFTMEDLTKRMRVSKSSLYKIVSSKDEIVSEVINELIRSFNKKESEILAEERPILEKLKLFTQSFMVLTQGFDNSMYGDLQRFYEKEWKKWIEFRQTKIDVFMRMFQEGINEGVLRPVNSAVFYQCLSASMTAIANPDFLESIDLTYSQAINTLQDIVFNGVLQTQP